MKRHRPTEPNDIKLLRGQKGGEHAAEEKVCHSVPLVLQLHRRSWTAHWHFHTNKLEEREKKKKIMRAKSKPSLQPLVQGLPTWLLTWVVTPAHPPTQSIYPFTRPFIHSITNQTHLQSLPPALTTNLSSQENRTLVT